QRHRSSSSRTCPSESNTPALFSSRFSLSRRIQGYNRSTRPKLFGIKTVVFLMAVQRLRMNKYFFTLCLLLTAAAVSFSQQAPTPAPDAKPAAQQSSQSSAHKSDKASAYYHYSMAHIYEELVAVYGRSDLASKAIEEYRMAIEADPTSSYLTSGLAELYAKTGRIRDAVLEAQDILKRDPNNLEAHKLLGR